MDATNLGSSEGTLLALVCVGIGGLGLLFGLFHQLLDLLLATLEHLFAHQILLDFLRVGRGL